MDDNQGLRELEPTGGTADDGHKPADGNGASASGYQPRKIRVKGQEFVIDSPDKELDLLQKGAAFDKNQAELKEARRRDEAERAKFLNDLEPLLEIDRRLRNDPATARRVQAALNGEPIPEYEGDTDDPYMERIGRLERNFERVVGALSGKVEGVTGQLGEVRRDRDFVQQERYIRRKWDWATDDDLYAAEQYAREKGVSLVSAFKEVMFDELPDRVRRDTFRELDIDESALTPARSEELILEGLGPVNDPRVQARLYDDPDLYARFKPSLRAARRARTGKMPYVR